jgi:cytoskeletal protein CcmA (bactofilin family)
VIDVKKTKPEGGAIIGAGTFVRGRIAGDEDLIVLGRVEGEIDLGRGAIIVERGAIVRANVRAGAARIAGALVGNVVVADLLHLAASARLVGDLRSGRLVIEPGAQLSGQVEMAEAERDRAAPAPRRVLDRPTVEERPADRVPNVDRPPVVERAPIVVERAQIFEPHRDEPELEPAEPLEPLPTERPASDRRKKVVLKVRQRAE